MWIATSVESERIRVRAALLQHEYAIRIRDAIARERWSIADYADAAGSTTDHINKLLRGVAVMSLADIATADILVGKVSELEYKRKSGAAAKKRRLELAVAEELRMRPILSSLKRSGRWPGQ